MKPSGGTAPAELSYERTHSPTARKYFSFTTTPAGNPIEYWTFIRAFENLIKSKTSSQNACLHYLVQYTTGEVREIVESCLTLKEDLGYEEARNLMQKRYRKRYRIATGYIDKLAKDPASKAEDGDVLRRRFSTVLTSCKIPLITQDISTIKGKKP